MLTQVLLLREVQVTFQNVELLYLLVPGLWLVWSATGAWLGRLKQNPAPHDLARLLVMISAGLPLNIVLFRSVQPGLNLVPGSYLPLSLQFISLLILTAPLAVLQGCLFVWSVRWYVDLGKPFSQAYVFECGGSILGGACSVFVVTVGFSTWQTTWAAAFLTALSAVQFSRQKSRMLTRHGGLILFTVVFFVFANRTDLVMERWTHPGAVSMQDTAYSRLTVTRQQDQVTLFSNNQVLAESNQIASEELVHCALLQKPDASRILVILGSIQNIPVELQYYNPDLIEVIEINPAAVTIANTLINRDLPKRSSQVKVIFSDPRQYLDQSGEYDLILVGGDCPGSLFSNRLYTVEFFQLCQPHLTDNGLLSFQLSSPANLRTDLTEWRDGAILQAARETFADVFVLSGERTNVLASKVPLTRDENLISRRFAEIQADTRLMSRPYVEYLYRNDRTSALNQHDRFLNIPRNSDRHPVSYSMSLVMWISQFIPESIPELHRISRNWRNLGPWMIGVILLVPIAITVLSRRISLGQHAHLRIFLVGFVGMLFECLLLAHYQTEYGILYKNIGLLLTAYMIGMVLGAVSIGHHFSSAVDCASPPIRIGRWLSATFLFTVGIHISALQLGLIFPSALLMLEMLVTGMFVAGIFTLTVQAVTIDSRQIGPLYAVDLLGGALGSLMASIFIIPFMGLMICGLVVTGLTLAVLVTR